MGAASLDEWVSEANALSTSLVLTDVKTQLVCSGAFKENEMIVKRVGMVRWLEGTCMGRIFRVFVNVSGSLRIVCGWLPHTIKNDMVLSDGQSVLSLLYILPYFKSFSLRSDIEDVAAKFGFLPLDAIRSRLLTHTHTHTHTHTCTKRTSRLSHTFTPTSKLAKYS
eukprot:GHVR01029863.1.p1 GENE.GHVR01029863.1~~GHVR01029863.1.p1  ORF type:complete len:166 (-),score=54.87 GHVR01029863.1:86-583(-)